MPHDTRIPTSPALLHDDWLIVCQSVSFECKLLANRNAQRAGLTENGLSVVIVKSVVFKPDVTEMTVKLLILLAVTLLSHRSECHQAVLHVSDWSTYREYCMVYNASLSNISRSLSDAVRYKLVNLTSTMLCDASGVKPDSVKGAAVCVMRGDCTFIQKAQVAQQLGVKVLLIASKDAMGTPSLNNSDVEKVTIPVALMRYRDILDVQKVFTDGMEVQLYAPLTPEFDASVIIMLAIAVFTVAMGGFWSGAAEKAKQSVTALSAGEERSDSGDLTLYSPLKVMLFVALMCVMLVLMYFFYKYLVYVIIVIFCLASATGLYSCLEALLNAVGCSKISVSCREKSFSVRNLLLGAVCITLAVVWGVYRNEDRWIWILQDVLGVAFCLNFMKTITLSNYKICVILLSLLLVYDVFFVFITPFLTANGESIMVQVALGPGAGGEKLPVVMRIPRFSAWAENLCEMQFSILGYGDIIIPGLLVAYCHRFDVWIGSSNRIYFISCAVAYTLGLVLTFVVMLLSKMGQPALLYLVPFTLLASGLLAWKRKEFKQFWAGTTYQVLDSSREPLIPDGDSEYPRAVRKC
ncbi:signal peptide peptidase-like 2A isoform X3 [Tachysurus fulvidraco]|uniref:signal peptide peptidase-like 2A isoform X3 n=1 Tax=Tachysurus fulvidraco TaxID=1234273 RepID=UPI001FEED72B|nr:signal peptide peptidase-like 2A isoform X3 [Tachysurus fulvidraco]